MAFKDYYRILGVAPNATPADIKKRFRVLVLQYHPDRNEDNEFAVVRFREVQEAYNALSDQSQRMIYDREWKLQFPDAPLSKVKEISAASILEEADALLQYIRHADVYRFNRDFIYTRLTDILSTENVAFLQHAADRRQNTEIVRRLMDAAGKLSWKKLSRLLPPLQELFRDTDLSQPEIAQWKRMIRLNDYWERYYPLVAFLIAALICFLIFRMSR